MARGWPSQSPVQTLRGSLPHSSRRSTLSWTGRPEGSLSQLLVAIHKGYDRLPLQVVDREPGNLVVPETKDSRNHDAEFQGRALLDANPCSGLLALEFPFSKLGGGEIGRVSGHAS